VDAGRPLAGVLRVLETRDLGPGGAAVLRRLALDAVVRRLQAQLARNWAADEEQTAFGLLIDPELLREPYRAEYLPRPACCCRS
jgi:hypothetical protein